MSDDPIRERTRLYLITPPVIDDFPLFRDRLLHALDAGDVACLQLRLKSSGEIDEASTQRLAETILADVQSRGVAVIVNDSVMLAENLLADGVHIGREDGDISEARKRLGTEAIIGATCKSSRHAAMEAGEAGANYVAFGSFYPTTTKADATPASVDVLQFWQDAMTLP
ncbi:MAG: thiamine phosphate synthase, partial [Pseudomonadota bacterium]